jgi:solute carrier family 25 (mitochondrial carnitine/acylcarnitine transporter), member 20/29
MLVNEIVKERLAKYKGVEVSQLSLGHRLLAGACAALSYWFSTYPLDVIKGRMQAMPYNPSTTLLSVARTMYADGGLRSFARGLGPCAARAIPAGASLFATVDIVRTALQRNFDHYS